MAIMQYGVAKRRKALANGMRVINEMASRNRVNNMASMMKIKIMKNEIS